MKNTKYHLRKNQGQKIVSKGKDGVHLGIEINREEEGHQEVIEGHQEVIEGHQEVTEGHQEVTKGHQEVIGIQEEVEDQKITINQKK